MPQEQLARLQDQQRDRVEGGDVEAHPLDVDYCGTYRLINSLYLFLILSLCVK